MTYADLDRVLLFGWDIFKKLRSQPNPWDEESAWLHVCGAMAERIVRMSRGEITVEQAVTLNSDQIELAAKGASAEEIARAART